MPTSQTYQLQLSWLNSLGGWEYWTFLARKSYGYKVGKSKTVKRDVFQDWDTTFIAGVTEEERLKIDANETVTVRSQLLTEQQINAISKIKLSIKVWDILEGVAVIIDPMSSFEYRTEGEKLHEISFRISYPSEQIQSI